MIGVVVSRVILFGMIVSGMVLSTAMTSVRSTLPSRTLRWQELPCSLCFRCVPTSLPNRQQSRCVTVIVPAVTETETSLTPSTRLAAESIFLAQLALSIPSTRKQLYEINVLINGASRPNQGTMLIPLAAREASRFYEFPWLSDERRDGRLG